MTRRWMRFTAWLTCYEGPLAAAFHNFDLHRRMLDIGGNGGKFAVQICHDLVLVILPLLFRLGGGGIGSGRPVLDAVLTLTNRRC
jgi:hypothetical protein